MINCSFIIDISLDAFFAAIAAIGFSVIANPPKKAIFVSAFLAAVGHSLRYYLLNSVMMDIAGASFIAALVIGMLSMYFAKSIHCPAEVFSFPSLLPMIPGMYAYKTVLALVKFTQCKEDSDSLNIIIAIFRNGTTTIFVLFALVVGVAIPMFFFHKHSYAATRVLNRNK